MITAKGEPASLHCHAHHRWSLQSFSRLGHDPACFEDLVNVSMGQEYSVHTQVYSSSLAGHLSALWKKAGRE